MTRFQHNSSKRNLAGNMLVSYCLLYAFFSTKYQARYAYKRYVDVDVDVEKMYTLKLSIY